MGKAKNEGGKSWARLLNQSEKMQAKKTWHTKGKELIQTIKYYFCLDLVYCYLMKATFWTRDQYIREKTEKKKCLKGKDWKYKKGKETGFEERL